jgi:hypothetical protein
VVPQSAAAFRPASVVRNASNRTNGGNAAVTSIRDDGRMAIDFTAPTEAAALAARDRLGVLAKEPTRDERSAARVAKSAIFEEALLGALKARLAELRMVAR